MHHREVLQIYTQNLNIGENDLEDDCTRQCVQRQTIDSTGNQHVPA